MKIPQLSGTSWFERTEVARQSVYLGRQTSSHAAQELRYYYFLET